MCNKAVHRCFVEFDSSTNQYKTQEICDRIVFKEPFVKVYCPDK